MRPIDADELENDLRVVIHRRHSKRTILALYLLLDIIRNRDTIKAEPMKHGNWKHVAGMNSKCSECGCYFPVKEFESRPFDINYCPSCGAKMYGGEKDDKNDY